MSDVGSLSVSKIQTFLDCQKKYKLNYVDGVRIWSPHFEFGTFAHYILENIDDEDVLNGYLETIKNTENLNEDLINVKAAFDIPSLYEYGRFLIYEFRKFWNINFKDFKLIGRELKIKHELVGVIDLCLYNPEDKTLWIVDYKTSKKAKTIDDLSYDLQLYYYIILLNDYPELENYEIDQIKLAYISVPKWFPQEPRQLKNGELSQAKDSPVTYTTYMKRINELGLDVSNYEEYLQFLDKKEVIQLAVSLADMALLGSIEREVPKYLNAVKYAHETDTYLEQFNSYQCNKCEYRDICKNKKL